MKVVSYKNLPPRSPILGTIVYYLLLEHFHAPSWVYGVTVTLLGVVAFAWIIALYKAEYVDIFEEKK